jgi:hypothetical protein
LKFLQTKPSLRLPFLDSSSPANKTIPPRDEVA